ncbi:MAG TPA: CHAT domain-containing protein [Steroidobacteraceae bacterium]|nr:CHAT domain-containing protein [Steroidobacteraceae bacterium]
MGAITEYKDFEIAVSSDAGAYFAEVVKSPSGECARTRITLPFDPVYAAEKVELAILRSARGMRQTVRMRDTDLLAVGKGIFNALLHEPPEIRSLYIKSRASLQDNVRLRLKLRIDADALSRLPFEFLYDNFEVKDYLGLHFQTSLVRYMRMDRPSTCLAVDGPLRILAMVANPRTDLYPDLNVTGERNRIEKAIAKLHERGEVDFKWVRGETHNDLFEALVQGPWHVFHFIGHGDAGEEVDGEYKSEGSVILTSESGGVQKVSGSDLRRLLGLQSSLRLVILNCCNSSTGSMSVARSLVTAGVPAVLAMQFPISDDAAIELASGFYTALSGGEPVDGAVTAARIKMSVIPTSRTEWGTPILHMRSTDGQIFSRKAVSPGSPPSPAPPALTATRPLLRVVPAVAVPKPEPTLDTQESAATAASPAVSGPFGVSGFAELEEAADEREAALRGTPLDATNMRDLTTEQLVAAAEWGEKARKQQPTNEPLLKRLAAAYFELGSRFRRENANKSFVNISMAVQLNPANSEYVYTRANMFARSEQFEFAERDINKAIELDPARGELHWAKGVIHLLEARKGMSPKQLQNAIDSFNRAITCDHAVAKYYSSRGAAYHRLGNLEKAREDLDKALALDPTDGKTYYNSAHVRQQQQDQAGAIRDLRSAIAFGYALAARELQLLEAATETRH